MKRWLVLLVVVLALSLSVSGVVYGQRGGKAVDTDDNRINDDLETMIDELEPEGKVPVIVIFSAPGFEPGKKHMGIANSLSALEARAGKIERGYSYENIPAHALKLNKAQIRALAEDPSVLNIQFDAEVHTCMGTASNYFGATKARTDFGVTGNMDGSETTYSKNDVVVAVIDTGIYTGHSDLDGGKVIAWKDWVNNRTTPYDDNGHGSHCAGIIAGTGEGNATYKGVAPGAALIGLKVLDSAGSGSMSNVDAAVDWCITNKATYNIRVISMSLGTSGSSNGSDSTSLLVNKAYDNNIAVCVAAGNAGPAKYTVGSPGAAAKAITVGAMADPGEKGFYLAYFSSRGPTADGRTKPDVAAPGYNITSVMANSSASYTTMSGTSMATPFTAGTAALMVDAYPSITAATIKSTLTNTVVGWGPSGQDIDYGYGRLQTYEAVKSAGGFSGTGPAVPSHWYYTGSLSGTGQSYNHYFSVTSTSYPIAITFIIGTTADFDIYLYNPAGTQVAKATGTKRQETLTYTPTTTGSYRLRVYSYSGSGSYFWDLSCK